MSNPVDDAKETVEDAVEEVPEPVVTDPPSEAGSDDEGNETTHSEKDDRPGWVDEIIEKLDSITVASPVTEPAEEVFDETPIRKPWTHRGFGK